MKKLIYDSFRFEYPEIFFYFKDKSRTYENKIILYNFSKDFFKKQEKEVINNIFFHIGMAIVPYMFVLEDYDEIVVRPYFIKRKAKEFFSVFYRAGLGEFRYRNKMNPLKEIKIKNAKDAKVKTEVYGKRLEERALVLSGGGKDSVVLGEMIKEMDMSHEWFILNPHPTRKRKMETLGEKEFLSTSMIKLDPRIKELKKYKGHKPLSALLAFTSLLYAFLIKSKYVMVGNEFSSNFGNLNIKDFNINHQYSKSYKFEKDFYLYARKNIMKDIYYFSALRPLYDIQIGKIFSNYPKYLKNFNSCNETQGAGVWCKKCPKCAFVFLILYPFLDQSRMLKIFGEDLFDNESIRNFIVDLCLAKEKPFECVGRRDESKLALALSIEKNKNLKKKPYFKDLEKCLDGINFNKLKKQFLSSWKRENNFPRKLKKDIFTYYEKFLKSK